MTRKPELSSTSNPSHRLAAAMRALSGKCRWDIQLTISDNNQAEQDAPLQATSQASLTLTTPHHQRSLRGQSDYHALVKKLHCSRTHQQHRPEHAQAAQLFDALEEERIALHGKDLKGVAVNIDTVWLKDNQNRSKDEDDAHAALEVALRGSLRQHSAHLSPAVQRWCRKNEPIWRDHLSAVLYQQLEFLVQAQGDQPLYAERARQLIDSLFAKDEVPPQQQPTPQEQQEQAPPEEQADGTPPPSTTPSAEQQPQQGGENPPTPTEEPPLSLDDDHEHDEDASPLHVQERPQHKPKRRYRVFTHVYDQIKHATELCSAPELAELRRKLDTRTRQFDHIVTHLAKILQRKLMAKQKRWWEFDQEQGILDGAKLARLVTNPTTPAIWKAECTHPFKDTIVTLLIDNSGSMRGKPIAIAASCADILARTLERCAIKVEILGFTTVTWKGGKAREQWLRQKQPAHPGRLNDLNHIIYKSANTPWRRARNHLGLMLREGLLKENIDGEALLWAYQRLQQRHEARRILIVISDGAPVDDSTFSANKESILEDHLNSVVAMIENQHAIELMAIGIGHDVSRYYHNAVTISDADALGPVLTHQLANLFDISWQNMPSPHPRTHPAATHKVAPQASSRSS